MIYFLINKKNAKYDESKQNFNKFATLKRACSFFTRLESRYADIAQLARAADL